MRRDLRGSFAGNPKFLFNNHPVEQVVTQKHRVQQNPGRSIFDMIGSFGQVSQNLPRNPHLSTTSPSKNHEKGMMVTGVTSTGELTTPTVDQSTLTPVTLNRGKEVSKTITQSRKGKPEGVERSFSIQAGPLGMSYNETKTGNNSWSMRVVARTGLKPKSNSSRNNSTRKSSVTTAPSNLVNNIGKIFWKRRLLDVKKSSKNETEVHLYRNPFSKGAAETVPSNVIKRPEASDNRLQRAWDQSVQTSGPQRDNMRVPVSPKVSNPKSTLNISPPSQTLLRNSNVAKVTQVSKQSSLNDTFPSNSQKNRQPSHSPDEKSVSNFQSNLPTGNGPKQEINPFSRPAKKINLQEIWDNSIKDVGKNQANSNETQKDKKQRYQGETMSLQEIWDKSFPNRPYPQGSERKIENGQKISEKQGQIQSERGQNLQPKQSKEPMQKRDRGSAVSNLNKVPDVSLSSDHLPPKSMRSKVLRFSYKPQSGKKYAVIAVAAIGTDYNYAFTLPLTVLSWQRIGYGVIVFAIGSEESWVSNPILYYVLKELRRLDPVVLFFDVSIDNHIFMSQVSRIFASNVFDWRGMESTPLVMSDVDIWPLTKEMYDIPSEKKIVSLNSDCCGAFRHRDQMFKMVPMCNVIMSVETWRDLIGVGVSGSRPITERDIIDYFKVEFGNIAELRVNKGENDGWYLDQHMVSVRLSQYAQRHGSETIQYEPRNTGRDRVDRNYWFPYGITRRNDVHVLENIYQPRTWERSIPILRQMYDETKNRDLEQYRDGFIRMLLNYKIPS